MKELIIYKFKRSKRGYQEGFSRKVNTFLPPFRGEMALNTTLAKWMTAMIAAVIMFAPLLAYADSLNRSAVNSVLYEAAKEASIHGYFTPEILEDMEDVLANHYNFDLSKFQINVTETVVYRPNPETPLTDDDYIEAQITFPSIPVFLFLLPNNSGDHVEKVRVLSEFTD